MKEYIDKEKVLQILTDSSDAYGTFSVERSVYLTARQKVRNIPAADVVSKSAFEQVVWERDTAIRQLSEDYGVVLGEKKRDAAQVVRCKDCRYWDEDGRCEPHENGLILEYTMPTDFCSYGKPKEKNT